MQDLLLVEEVDVRRLDDPEDSRVCTITKMLLPAIKLKTAEHTAGGGVGTVKYRLPMIEALEPTMSVKGLDVGTIAAAGFIPGVSGGWIFAASVRNTSTNKIVPLRATVKGVVTEYTPGEHTPGELLDVDHAFHEVTDYELVVDGEQWFKFSARGRELVMYGVDLFEQYRTALGV
ncbi:phage major tail tube protein [Methylobacterium gnaphalii]|uniref:Uncharacterized protein n=1 Tax=Methylobacterium gnaphalii TaxID=1010610 RepID=A0A512JPE1_9HYPH|nr:phage major tail tube protein [Methylobacterium gnaphalii]GEP11830.1 hypothetical protein MGN01_36750 [Methylobacterium gnaphalii]GJD69414.1 hypothetical protein MMMDOFMJ_2345 [Methylobacterium gnaphalii]GLS51395.1 hypothetical protein GCM10007885_42520 [Methylobacterium gnaphalii]